MYIDNRFVASNKQTAIQNYLFSVGVNYDRALYPDDNSIEILQQGEWCRYTLENNKIYKNKDVVSEFVFYPDKDIGV